MGQYYFGFTNILWTFTIDTHLYLEVVFFFFFMHTYGKVVVVERLKEKGSVH